MNHPSQQVLARMPLAEAVLWLWRWVMCEERLHALGVYHRGRCYEKLISFPLMVPLIADALVQYHGSGRRSFEKNIETQELPASGQAAYKKLGRLPISLSQAFVGECTAALQAVLPAGARRPLPGRLGAFCILLLDGKAVKRVAKRLGPLRGITGGLLGGRALVAVDWCTGLAVAMQADPDGEANDVRFVSALVPVVRKYVEGPRLWLADSAFCDLEQPTRFTAAAGDHFLVRYHPKGKFHPDSLSRKRQGTTAAGQIYTEQWGWLGSGRDKRRRFVRLIRLECPGRRRDVVLGTDLLDAEAYLAPDLLWLYAQRWGIEEMFQQVTEVFGLQGLIGGTPQACLFQLAFCLVLYHMIHVVRGYVAEGQACPPEAISLEKLFDDIERQLIAWTVLFDPQVTQTYFQPLPVLEALQARLRLLLGAMWSTTWDKAPPQKRQGKTRTKRTCTHHSVYRILHAHNRRTHTHVPRRF